MCCGGKRVEKLKAPKDGMNRSTFCVSVFGNFSLCTTIKKYAFFYFILESQIRTTSDNRSVCPLLFVCVKFVLLQKICSWIYSILHRYTYTFFYIFLFGRFINTNMEIYISVQRCDETTYEWKANIKERSVGVE